MASKEEFLNQARTSELWTAIKTHVAMKISNELEDYATNEGVATAIVTALQTYPDNSDLAEAIKTALTDYMTKTDVTEAIAQAVGNITSIKIEILDKLPETGEEMVLYFIRLEASETRIFSEIYGIDFGDDEYKLVTAYVNNSSGSFTFQISKKTTIDDVYVNLVNSPLRVQGYTFEIDEKTKAIKCKLRTVEANIRFEIDGQSYTSPKSGDSSDIFDEYMWVNNAFEKIGSTRIDLSNYWSKDELQPMTKEALADILV